VTNDVRASVDGYSGRAKRFGSGWLVGLALLVAASASARDYVEANLVGDVMMARRFEEAPDGFIFKFGPDALWHAVRDRFLAADLNVINLETPLTTRGAPHPTKSYVFRTNPAYAKTLDRVHVNAANLANNHSYDYGDVGLKDTLDTLDAAGIARFGGGMNLAEAREPRYLTFNGVKIALLGFCSITGRLTGAKPYLDAEENKPGAMRLSEEYVTEGVQRVRRNADVVIVVMHSGTEYSNVTADFTRRMARLAIDTGADLVVAHHPHVLQGIEVYKGKPIAYSLGDFVFDKEEHETLSTAILNCKIDKNGVFEARIIPTFIENFVPKPVTGAVADAILRRLAEYSGNDSSVINASDIGYIGLASSSFVRQNSRFETTIPLGDDQQSYPWLLTPGAYVESLSSDSPADARFGRDILLFGDFENDGATLWDINSDAEIVATNIVHTGKSSLKLVRTDANSSKVQTHLTSKIPVDHSRRYTLSGFARSENGANVNVTLRWYTDRETGLVQATDAIVLNGTTAWQFFSLEERAPLEAKYVDVFCSSEPPKKGASAGWFDGLTLIEWDAWRSLPLTLPSPNGFGAIQFRAADARQLVVSATTTTFTVLPPNRMPPEESEPVAGDINGDGGVNIVDLVTVASAFGSSGTSLPADVNGDGVVNIVDLVFVASRFGSASPSATVDGSLARQIEAWLTESRSVASDDPSYRRGIEVLESLLATYRASETALLPAYPNPFNPEVWIPYRLAEPSSVVVTIYGSDGSVVRRLDIGAQTSGNHTAPKRAAHWDGRNAYGEPVGSGVYFVELVAGSFRDVRSILLSK
jgi:poly-gamma-glutamate capsule biosynthesis protein CapA/YwtB (metallophosphatase superfamily)